MDSKQKVALKKIERVLRNYIRSYIAIRDIYLEIKEEESKEIVKRFLIKCVRQYKKNKIELEFPHRARVLSNEALLINSVNEALRNLII